MKGHTHEDCDQLFSCYGTKISSNVVVTAVEGMSINWIYILWPG
jgi:hypothetical protein